MRQQRRGLQAPGVLPETRVVPLRHSRQTTPSNLCNSPFVAAAAASGPLSCHAFHWRCYRTESVWQLAADQHLWALVAACTVPKAGWVLAQRAAPAGKLPAARA